MHPQFYFQPEREVDLSARVQDTSETTDQMKMQEGEKCLFTRDSANVHGHSREKNREKESVRRLTSSPTETH